MAPDTPRATLPAAVFPAVIASAGLVAVAALRLSDHGWIRLPHCPFYSLTGCFCPGCGSTRMLRAILRMDLARAFVMNPLLFLALPVMALMTLSAGGYNPPALAGFRRIAGNPRLWLVVLLAYWVARNLPWPPFSWLAPGGLGWAIH